MDENKFQLRFPRETELPIKHPEIYDKVTELLEREGYYTTGYGEDGEGFFVCYGTESDPKSNPLIQQAKDEGLTVRIKYNNSACCVIGKISACSYNCHFFRRSESAELSHHQDSQISEIVTWVTEKPTPLGEQKWHAGPVEHIEGEQRLISRYSIYYGDQLIAEASDLYTRDIILGTPALVKACQDYRGEKSMAMNDALKAMGVLE